MSVADSSRVRELSDAEKRRAHELIPKELRSDHMQFAIENRSVFGALQGLVQASQPDASNAVPSRVVRLFGGVNQLAVLMSLAKSLGLVWSVSRDAQAVVFGTAEVDSEVAVTYPDEERGRLTSDLQVALGRGT